MTKDFIYNVLAEMFSTPCNFSPTDEIMLESGRCENDCGEIGGNWCYPTGEVYEHSFDPVLAWMPLPEPWKGAEDERI